MTRAPAAAAVVAGLLVVAGSFADWTGVAYSSSVDRDIALGAGLAAATVGVLALRRRRAVVAALAPSVVALNMGIVNYDDVANHAHEYAAYPDAEVGAGIYLVIAGGALAALAGLAGAVPQRWLR